MLAVQDQPQPERLDPADEASLRRWAEKFAVSEAQLLEAVRAVGTDPERVGAWLLAAREDRHTPPPGRSEPPEGPEGPKPPQ